MEDKNWIMHPYLTNEYENILRAASFKVLVHKIRVPQCGEAIVWVAQKI